MQSAQVGDGVADGGLAKRITDRARSIGAAVTGAVEAVSGKFRALAGLSTGSLAAADRRFNELYTEARKIMGNDVGWLKSYEVDEIISAVVQAELNREPGDERSWFAMSAADRRNYLFRCARNYVMSRDARHDRHLGFKDVSTGQRVVSMDPASADAFDDAVADALDQMGVGRQLYIDVRFSGLRHAEAALKYGLTTDQVKARMTAGNKLMGEACLAYKEGRRPVYPKMYGKPGRPRKSTTNPISGRESKASLRGGVQ